MADYLFTSYFLNEGLRNRRIEADALIADDATTPVRARLLGWHPFVEQWGATVAGGTPRGGGPQKEGKRRPWDIDCPSTGTRSRKCR